MVVQDRRGGGAAAVAMACGTGLAVGLLTTGCSPEGAAADDQEPSGRAARAGPRRAAGGAAPAGGCAPAPGAAAPGAG
ncbi:hypothetical protein ACFW1M_19360, partial [Streptomyces inhibens]